MTDHEFTLHATLPRAPEVVWPFLSYPKKIWWLGPFSVTAGPDPEAPYGVGSTRRVLWIVEETILKADPYGELHYAVTRSKDFENHHAVMKLEDRGEATQLTWTVGFDSTWRKPERHARFIERYLTGRLAALKNKLARL